ncbi:MAG TPA: shikimate dehydrogenase [Micropepsaceae bacterium]|nr:shikimate dehydrogenase [Micropepsaceae bacterium]
MSGQGKLAAVIGWPVHQSLSPVMHNHWLSAYGIAGNYLALPVRPEDFEATISNLPSQGYVGVSVTVPHKEAAFRLAAERDEDSTTTGAVNTLVFASDAIKGMNTDVRGFAASLADSLGPGVVRNGRVVVLGAGGAARAVVLALARMGAFEIRLLNRTRARAEALKTQLGRVARIEVLGWEETASAFAGAQLLVNTTSLGMIGKERLELSLDGLPNEAAVADIVYNPLETELLHTARARGHRVVDGLGMLMHQAVPAFAAWFGVTPKVTPELRARLTEALRG